MPHDIAIRIGVPAIDREHLALLRQLDRLTANPDAHPGDDAFTEVLSRLGRQISTHFETEEEILRSCGMPQGLVQEHFQAHTEILEQYAGLNLDLMAGKLHSRDDALALVKGWIVDHVRNYDVKISNYLSGEDAGSISQS